MSSMGRGESKAEKERQKQIQDRCQALLTQMLRDEDNKYCVDCDAKGPRWASWNLGVFLCIRCAGIHRNLGVHISKVKSVNLDTWTPEQVVSLQQMGNSRARAVYEASLPDSWRRPQTDSNLEAFIRAKYQQKRYIAKEWVAPAIPKVDWDKELDEEMERQKKRKKEKQASSLPPVRKIVLDTNVPALPKPTSSPKSSRTASATPAATDTSKTSSAVDLLGLSTSNSQPAPTTANGSDDAFTSFLSGPTATPAAPVAVAAAAPQAVPDVAPEKGRSDEENNFFNQSAPVNEPKKPLSKDSIMALFSQNAAPAQQNMFMGAGMYPATSAPFAAPIPTYQNGMQLQQQQQQSVPPGSNPFFGMSMAMSQPHVFPVQHGSTSAKPSDDLLADFSAPAVNNNLQHQMAGLNLSSQPPATNFPGMHGNFPLATNYVGQPNQQPMGQTFTSHLWQ